MADRSGTAKTRSVRLRNACLHCNQQATASTWETALRTGQFEPPLPDVLLLEALVKLRAGEWPCEEPLAGPASSKWLLCTCSARSRFTFNSSAQKLHVLQIAEHPLTPTLRARHRAHSALPHTCCPRRQCDSDPVPLLSLLACCPSSSHV